MTNFGGVEADGKEKAETWDASDRRRYDEDEMRSIIRAEGWRKNERARGPLITSLNFGL